MPQDATEFREIRRQSLENPHLRRNLKSYPYLQHRYFDPQIYLAGLNSRQAPTATYNLATFPWFDVTDSVPSYDSSRHGTMKQYKERFSDELVDSWAGQPPTDPDLISRAVREAVLFQVQLGCEGIILPSPMTAAATGDYESELRWLDCGLEVCQDQRISLPVFATVAISDPLLRGTDPDANALINTITDQVSARPVAGAYIVIEQASERGYSCTHPNTLYSLLLLVDDLVRGAGKRVIVNYMGTFGAVLRAAGASVWSTGYYLSQRRLRLADFETSDARAYPRYHSFKLAGDIGVRSDLETIVRSGLGPAVFYESEAARPLHAALLAGRRSDDVPAWKYEISNIRAAQVHHTSLMRGLGLSLEMRDDSNRINAVNRWLERASELATQISQLGIRDSYQTELSHQETWLQVFERWRKRSGL